MAIVNSNEKDLSIPEIITNALGDAERKGGLDGMPLEVAILSVVKEGSLPNTEVTKIGNTVFITHYDEDRTEVHVRTLSADTARNYLRNVWEYVRGLSEAGVERLTSDFSDRKVIPVFESIINRPEFSDWGVAFYELENGDIRAYMVMTEE